MKLHISYVCILLSVRVYSANNIWREYGEYCVVHGWR